MILTIILLIISIAVLIAMLIDKHRHPEAYREVEAAARRPKKRRRRSSEYTYTGLPWMGGKKIKKRY